MQDSYFPVMVMVVFGVSLIGYFLFSRHRVADHARVGWILEIVGASIGLVGAGVAFFASNVRIGAAILVLGVVVGSVGLYLFTRPPKA